VSKRGITVETTGPEHPQQTTPRFLIVLSVETVGINILNELERIVAELFSVADGDVSVLMIEVSVGRVVFDQCGRGGSPPTASQYSSAFAQNSTRRGSIPPEQSYVC
jgi:hypothetical protein